jgi:hypothetical protein
LQIGSGHPNYPVSALTIESNVRAALLKDLT